MAFSAKYLAEKENNKISKAKVQRISDSNGCDLLNQISFKLITLNHSVNSLYLVFDNLCLALANPNSYTKAKANVNPFIIDSSETWTLNTSLSRIRFTN